MAALLQSGKVLVICGPCGTSADLYDPIAGTFVATGSMTVARSWQTATLLANGKVLVAGGAGHNYGVASAELYDPGSESFVGTGSMTTSRYYHTATLLANGKVLVAGGVVGTDGGLGSLASAELYDTVTGTFVATGSMTMARSNHMATLLQNGKVLISGGSGTSDAATNTLASAELYDPSTGSFAGTGSMTTARYYHTATLLANGKVLIVGGSFGLGTGSAELYDPSTGSFVGTGSMSTARTGHTATLLANGTVLIAGGTVNVTSSLPTAELYVPQ